MYHASIIIREYPDLAITIKEIRKVTFDSIDTIKNNILHKKPIIDHELFLNNHTEIEEKFRKLIQQLDYYNILYDVYEDEFKIDVETLYNIFDNHDKNAEQ